MLFYNGVYIHKDVGDQYELVKNDIGRHSNVRHIQ